MSTSTSVSVRGGFVITPYRLPTLAEQSPELKLYLGSHKFKFGQRMCGWYTGPDGLAHTLQECTLPDGWSLIHDDHIEFAGVDGKTTTAAAGLIVDKSGKASVCFNEGCLAMVNDSKGEPVKVGPGLHFIDASKPTSCVVVDGRLVKRYKNWLISRSNLVLDHIAAGYGISGKSGRDSIMSDKTAIPFSHPDKSTQLADPALTSRLALSFPLDMDDKAFAVYEQAAGRSVPTSSSASASASSDVDSLTSQLSSVTLQNSLEPALAKFEVHDASGHVIESDEMTPQRQMTIINNVAQGTLVAVPLKPSTSSSSSSSDKKDNVPTEFYNTKETLQYGLDAAGISTVLILATAVGMVVDTWRADQKAGLKQPVSDYLTRCEKLVNYAFARHMLDVFGIDVTKDSSCEAVRIKLATLANGASADNISARMADADKLIAGLIDGHNKVRNYVAFKHLFITYVRMYESLR